MRVFEIYGKYRNKKLLRLNVKIDALKKQKDEYKFKQLNNTFLINLKSDLPLAYF